MRVHTICCRFLDNNNIEFYVMDYSFFNTLKMFTLKGKFLFIMRSFLSELKANVVCEKWNNDKMRYLKRYFPFQYLALTEK